MLLSLLFSFGAGAQSATSMRINEVLVINEDNFVNDYGIRSGRPSASLCVYQLLWRELLLPAMRLRQKQPDQVSDT